MSKANTKRKGELFTGDYCRMARLVQIGEQWFFDTRDSIEGPFVSMQQAEISLEVYLRKLSGRALLEDASKRIEGDVSLSGADNFLDFSNGQLK
jgi:hypothetical protein